MIGELFHQIVQQNGNDARINVLDRIFDLKEIKNGGVDILDHTVNACNRTVNIGLIVGNKVHQGRYQLRQNEQGDQTDQNQRDDIRQKQGDRTTSGGGVHAVKHPSLQNAEYGIENVSENQAQNNRTEDINYKLEPAIDLSIKGKHQEKQKAAGYQQYPVEDQMVSAFLFLECHRFVCSFKHKIYHYNFIPNFTSRQVLFLFFNIIYKKY